jgi:S-adenosylmethionine:tRNA-ribosyltransferase-isomerase (queuine synthetase)
MHSEYYRVPEATMQASRRSRARISPSAPRPSARSNHGHWGELEGRTDLFIQRGYEFKVDVLMTNFHPAVRRCYMIDALVGLRWRSSRDRA